MSPRITWSPDGRRVLVCQRETLRIVDIATGETVRELAPRQIQLGTSPRHGAARSMVNATFFDGYWLHDGRIVAIDIFGTLVQFTMTGAQYSDPAMPPNPWHIDFAALSGDGQELVTFHLRNRVIVSTGERDRWELGDRTRYGIAGGSHAHARLSYDGGAIAIACALEYRNAEGRTTIFDHAWLALDLRTRSRVAPILGRGWGEASVLVFDRLARRLLIGSSTETKVVRLGSDFAPHHFVNRSADQLAALVHHEPPRCAALDDRGLRAVYGFASRSELRVDYLSPKRTGALDVEVLDQQQIAASFAPVALALDTEGTRIACLADDGRVEIVPVP